MVVDAGFSEGNAVFGNLTLAIADWEEPLEASQYLAQGFDIRVGSEIPAAVFHEIAGNKHSGEVFIKRHFHIRVALVVLEQDVIFGLMLFDEAGFEQECLSLAAGDYEIKAVDVLYELIGLEVFDCAGKI